MPSGKVTRLSSSLVVAVAIGVGVNQYSSSETIEICSFNIQWLGGSTKRDVKGLVGLLKRYDIVVVQELIAPPYSGKYPDGTEYAGDDESREFFDEMKREGFGYVLSVEDTGPGQTNHNQGPATEWWVTFYKPETVQPTQELPTGFLSDDVTNNADYERVPYAVGFRVKTLDFVLISVHLKPGKSNSSRRKHELESIAKWVDRNDAKEKDFVILGDTNIESADELTRVAPKGYASLNSTCLPTNTKRTKPYDHVMVRPRHSAEFGDFRVVDLVGEFKPSQYRHNEFRSLYSDHCPVVITATIGVDDD